MRFRTQPRSSRFRGVVAYVPVLKKVAVSPGAAAGPLTRCIQHSGAYASRRLLYIQQNYSPRMLIQLTARGCCVRVAARKRTCHS